MTALLIVEFCTTCQDQTDHELNTRALETECLCCKRVEQVSEAYAVRMMEE